MRKLVRLLKLTCLAVAAASAQSANPPPAPPNAPSRGAVHLEVKNGLFHVLDNVTIRVQRLDAWMVPQSNQTVSLDDEKSFALQIVSGETRLRDEQLTRLANEYLLPHARAPIGDLEFHFQDGIVLVKGRLKKKLNLPFQGKATVSLSGNSEIRVHFTDLTVAGILKKGLLDTLGIKLSSVAQPQRTSRFRIEGDDVILPIVALFPPPRVFGKLTAVRIEGNELMQVFGNPKSAGFPPASDAKNYIYFRGGRMRFGKVSMDDVDLELVDNDPSNLFDFSLAHYREQLDAGYTKSLPDLGLIVYMPDYAKVAGHIHKDN